MPQPSSVHRRTGRALAAVAVGLVASGVAVAPAPASAATPAPKPAPCPGTIAPTPTPSPSRPTGPRPTTSTAKPSATPAAAKTLPPPVVPEREVVVGGERLRSNGVVTDLPAGTPAPQLDATSWVIADATTGDVLAAKAPHALLRPASTLKAISALVMLPMYPDPEALVRATDADMKADGTKVGVVAGNRYRVRQLFSAMLMSSANDAVYALARSAPGGRDKVVAEANAFARDLGALDTVVKDPSGLDADGQVSSAYDLALVGRAALQDKQFRGYSTTRTTNFPGAVMPGGKKAAAYQINNHNKLLYNYPGAVGVKNGYTSLAHGTFIAAATRGGRTYLLTYMCSDTITWHQMAAALDWAFAHGPKARPVGTLVEKGTVTQTAGATPLPSDEATPADDATASDTTASAGAATTGATTDAPTAASGSSASRGLPGPVTTWWGSAVAAVALVGLGIAGSRRIGRGRHG